VFGDALDDPTTVLELTIALAFREREEAEEATRGGSPTA
jgi:hypothetical protein